MTFLLKKSEISNKAVLIKTIIMSLLVRIYSVHSPRGRDLEFGELMSHVDPPAGRKRKLFMVK